MSFGTTADTLLYEILFSLGALAAFGLLLFIGALLDRLFRIKIGCFPLIFALIIGLGTALGLSLYLDLAGQPFSATVTKTLETIHYREQGDWWHEYEVWVGYQLADGSEPSAHFGVLPAFFDQVQERTPVTVRSVSINGWFNLARFADQSTWLWLPWRWLGIGAGVILLGLIGWQLLKLRFGWLPVALILLGLATIPFINQYRAWRAANNPDLTPLSATGVITEVHPVTTIDPLPSDDGGEGWETEIEVVQPYTIVVVRYTPAGYRAPILGVDAVDTGNNGSTPRVDQTVTLHYAASDPRLIRLPDQQRDHYVRNPLAWLQQQLLDLALIALIIGFVSWAGNRWQRFLGQRLSRNQSDAE